MKMDESMLVRFCYWTDCSETQCADNCRSRIIHTLLFFFRHSHGIGSCVGENARRKKLKAWLASNNQSFNSIKVEKLKSLFI